MQTLYCFIENSIFKLGGVQRFARELERCRKEYRQLFNGNNRQAPERHGTIFQEIREIPTINECRLNSLNVLNSLLIFFNQNDYKITKDEFYDLQIDDVLSIYELLLKQNLEKKKQMDAIK